MTSEKRIFRAVLIGGSIESDPIDSQCVMGWEGYHLHQFDDGQTRYGILHPEYVFPIEDERKVKLSKLLTAEKDKLLYDYDFGDSWRHILLLKNILSPTPDQFYPVCIKGKRACPPEDSGGIWRYQWMLEVLAEPKHPKYTDLVEWLGEPLDPEAFDLTAINEAFRAKF